MEDLTVDSEQHGKITLTYIGGLSIELTDDQLYYRFDEYDKLHPKNWRNGKLNQRSWSYKTENMIIHYWTSIVDDKHQQLCDEWIQDVYKFFNK